MPRLPLLSLGLLLVLSVLTVGCSSARTASPRLHSVAGLYDEAAIEYRLGPQQLSGPLAVTHVEGQLVSFQMQSEEQLPQGANGTLRIEYPHRDAPADHARTTVIIEAPVTGTLPRSPTASSGWWSRMRGMVPSGKSNSAAGLYEEWVLDVPRHDLDMVLSELNAGQFFSERPAKAEASQLTVVVDGKRASRGWGQSERLNALILKVRSQGQLVRYSCPPKKASL